VNAAEILNAAADLIEPDGAWTQGALARTKRWREIGPHEGNAACFCAAGAIRKVAEFFPASRSVAWNLSSDEALFLGYETLPDFNDAPTTTQADVVALLRRAAIRAASCT